jgi:hypothetical protein
MKALALADLRANPAGLVWRTAWKAAKLHERETIGVVWNEEAWEMVKGGELRGYSIGGYSDRMYADLPPNGEREGIELHG